MNVIELNNASYSPPGSDVPIIRDLNLALKTGRILGITGESGSGKTTLIKILSGILIPSGGTANVSASNKQLLFQNNEFLINPFRTVNNIIEEALRLNRAVNDVAAEKKKLLNYLLIDESLWDKPSGMLSGGERQRTALARILAVKPDLLLLDEPFSAQDLEAQQTIIEIIKNLRAGNVTVVCVSHNINLLARFTDEICVMLKGSIVESGETSGVISSPSHAYTRFLIKAGALEIDSSELSSSFKYEQN